MGDHGGVGLVQHLVFDAGLVLPLSLLPEIAGKHHQQQSRHH